MYVCTEESCKNQLTAASLSKGHSKFIAAGSDPNHLLLVKKKTGRDTAARMRQETQKQTS